MKNIIKYILPLTFIFLLLFPYVSKKTNLLPNAEQEENRKLSEMPKVDWKHLDKFPRQYEDYFNDHFELRAFYLNIYNTFNYFFLKRSPAPEKAVLGKQNWVFEGSDMDMYRGSKRFTDQELELLKNEFIRRNNFLKSQNCSLLLVIIPTKKNLYPEYVPQEFYKYSKISMTSQLITKLNTETDIDIIDLCPLLMKAKSDRQLFHKSDNHWNDIGAYHSYKEIIKHLNQTMNVGEPHEFTDYVVSANDWEKGNLTMMLGMEGKIKDIRYTMMPKFTQRAKQLTEKYKSPQRFPYPWAYERRYEVENNSLPRLMMVNDSFGEYLYPFMAEHFSYSLFLFDVWEYNLHPLWVKDEKPDIFIVCITESLLTNLLVNLNREENVIN